jgi:hypothetical protein
MVILDIQRQNEVIPDSDWESRWHTLCPDSRLRGNDMLFGPSALRLFPFRP